MKLLYNITKCGFFQECKGYYNIGESTNLTHQLIKNNNHMIIPKRFRKTLCQNPTPFYVKNIEETRKTKELLNPIKPSRKSHS